jgi:hypothetical protein
MQALVPGDIVDIMMGGDQPSATRTRRRGCAASST